MRLLSLLLLAPLAVSERIERQARRISQDFKSAMGVDMACKTWHSWRGDLLLKR